ncbi:MAG: S-layer homology domain-containing protein [Bacillota bacterium]|nr:S-layer homology domain-containing protein [Bacillota bacterium]
MNDNTIRSRWLAGTPLRPLLITITLALALLLSAAYHAAFAEVIWVEAGLVGDKLINGQYEYEEVTFITGKPIHLKGTVKLSAPPKGKNKYTQSYSFELSNEAEKIALKRDVAFEVVLTPNEALGQTVQKRTLTKYAESITTPEGTFTLGKYNYLESRVTDNTPAVSYQSGNLLLEKTLYLDGDARKNSGSVSFVIDVKPIVGYEHRYGEQESRVVRQEIRSTRPSDKGDRVWTGIVDIGLSSLKKTFFEYQYTDPQNISFRGSYFKQLMDENVVTYTYDLYRPEAATGAGVGTATGVGASAAGASGPGTGATGAATAGSQPLDTSKRNQGTKRMSNRVPSGQEALVIPRIRDIAGLPAERAITLLTAMQAFDVGKEFYAPHTPIHRHEFAKALSIVIAGELPEPTRTEITRRLRPGVDTPYLDVLPADPDYHYIERYKKLGLVSGKNRYLKPDELLTRAEMVVMTIRALGIEHIAPNPPYDTIYLDTKKIPNWAKDAIYMGTEIGLVRGTDGYFHPHATVLREEAAQILYDLIRHLNDTITPDYREKLLNR